MNPCSSSRGTDTNPIPPNTTRHNQPTNDKIPNMYTTKLTLNSWTDWVTVVPHYTTHNNTQIIRVNSETVRWERRNKYHHLLQYMNHWLLNERQGQDSLYEESQESDWYPGRDTWWLSGYCRQERQPPWRLLHYELQFFVACWIQNSSSKCTWKERQKGSECWGGVES